MEKTLDQDESTLVVLVTGPSGAGRATAVKVLEDLGYEGIDNLPLSFLPRLFEGPPIGRPIALGIDVRNRDFSVEAMLAAVQALRAREDVAAEILYLDCAPDVLMRRYSETRRRHPMAPAESPQEGIEREIDLLGPIRELADVLIDTSALTPHDLRDQVQKWFRPEGAQGLALSLQSFSYKRGVPLGVDMVFDVRFLRNPYWESALRALDGRAPEVAAYIADDPMFAPFFEKVTDLAKLLLPAYRAEGKAHLAIAFGCTGGQHRSVALAEKLAATLAAGGWQVSIRHREIERRAGMARAVQSG